MTCKSSYINPLKLKDDGEVQESIDPTMNMGSGRRRKRSTTVKRKLRKRQEVTPDLSENRTLVTNLIITTQFPITTHM